MTLFPKVTAKSGSRLTFASQDYVEQLRTVHFALLSVSAGLLLLIMSAKTYDSRKAIVELEELLELKKEWSPAFLLRNAERIANSGAKDTVPLTHGPAGLDFKAIPVRVSVPGQKPMLFYLQPPAEDQFHWMHFDGALSIFPNTLSGIEVWWNELKKGSHILLRPAAIARDCDSSIPRSTCEVFHILRVPAGVLQRAPITTTDTDGDSILNCESDGDTLHVSFTFNVGSYWKHNVQQSDILPLFPDSKGGEFAAAFPDLHRATTELSSLELADVLKHLNADSTDSETFEAFGLKVPSDQVTAWGTVAILCIQLYLYVYLRAFKNPLEPSDDAWNIGWFAVNDAPLPRLIFFTTVFVLPSLAVILLSKHALDQRIERGGFVYDFKAFPVLVIACCLSLVLGYLNWRNRPGVR
jgi:hypothetical protein